MGPSDYALLELLDRLGGVQGRKKLQKLVYIAKLAGIPITDDFYFHYYGPYSSELACRVDQLAELNLLAERKQPLTVADGFTYEYEVASEGRTQLELIRPDVPADFCRSLERGISRAESLKDRDVFELELAATLLYWREKGHTQDEAEAITAQRKKAEPTSDAFKQARRIAGEVWDSREQTGD